MKKHSLRRCAIATVSLFPAPTPSYRDYQGQLPDLSKFGAPITAAQAPKNVHLEPTREPELLPAAAQNSRVPVVVVDEGQTITPTIHQAGADSSEPGQVLALASLASDGLQNNYCSYTMTSTGDPAPPASGSSWGADRGSYTKGWQITQALRDGWDSNSTSSSASLHFSLSLSMPSNWPQVSRITGYSAPSVQGTSAMRAQIGPLGQVSSASSSFTAEYGWSVGAQNYMNEYFNFSRETSAEDLVTRWDYDTPAGMAYNSEIAVQPGAIHKFRGESKVTAKATSNFGASAYSMVDFGSGGLDTPSADVNGHFHFNQDPTNTVLINYKTPVGFTPGC